MAIGSRNDQIRAELLGNSDESLAIRRSIAAEDLSAGPCTVTDQVADNIILCFQDVLLSFFLDRCDKDFSSMNEERHRIDHCAPSLARILPGDHDLMRSKRLKVSSGDEDRATG
ncbi:hypothetical protein N184_28825 [Sinorhizobium sp. GL28]|nr:hypothetical protein N184_28825 [Sinorhizobium sp. GL28]